MDGSEMVFDLLTLMTNNDTANGGSLTMVATSRVLDLDGPRNISIQLELQSIWGAESPQVDVKAQSSLDRVNFTDDGPTIDNKTAAGTSIASGAVAGNHVRFVVTLTQGAISTQTGPAAALLRLRFEPVV